MKSIEHLVEEALEAFDDPRSDVSGHVRRAIRIASRRQDYLALIRLLPETFDMSAGKVDHPGFEEARANLAVLLGKEEADRQGLAAILRQSRGRTKGGVGAKEMVFGQSIGQLESLLAQYDAVAASYSKPPESLTPIDAYFVTRDYDAASAKLLPLRRELQDVIERVKQGVYDFLIDTEHQIESGQRRPHVFDRGREYVEKALQERAPDALEKF